MAMLDRISVIGLVSEADFEAEKCGHGGTSVFMLFMFMVFWGLDPIKGLFGEKLDDAMICVNGRFLSGV